jgi:hypothetical protein
MVRVLVTVEPRMYREAIALGLQRLRPDAEVMLVPEEDLDGQVDRFRPQVLVRNDSDGAIPEGLLGSVVLRVEVLHTDGMAARISMGDESYTIEDASMEGLLSLLEEAEGLAQGWAPSPGVSSSVTSSMVIQSLSSASLEASPLEATPILG